MKKISGVIVFLFLFLGIVNAQPTGAIFFSFDQPLGNVAVTRHQVYPIQVFFSVHPESKPKGPKIYELKTWCSKTFS